MCPVWLRFLGKGSAALGVLKALGGHVYVDTVVSDVPGGFCCTDKHQVSGIKQIVINYNYHTCVAVVLISTMGSVLFLILMTL